MALHNPDIIAEPFGNLIDRHSTARQEGCKGVAHDMWRHPMRSLSGCVFRKRPAEIVPVKTFPPSRNLGMEHEWFSQAILPQELSEFLGHGDTALLAIFEGHRVGLTKMKNSVFYIEPEGSRFDDLIKAKACVKTAVKHEFQVFTGAFSNKPISKFRDTEVLSCRRRWRLDLDRRRGIFPAGSLYLHAPTEKAAKGHEISVSRPWGVSLDPFGVVTMDYFRRNLGRSDLTCPFRKAFQDVSFAAFSGQSPFSASTAIPNVTFHSVTENRSALQDAFSADFFGSAQCFNRIARLQADEMAFLVHLTSEPVDTASSIDAAHRILSAFHAQNCNTFTVTLSSPIREEMAGYEDK